MTNQESLDETDIKILKLLQQNSHMTVKELAARVIDLYCHNVVLCIGNGQRLLVIVTVEEVADDEGCATLFLRIAHILDYIVDIRTTVDRLVLKHLADDGQHMLLALLWRDVFLYPVAEEHHTYLIVVLNTAECECRCDLGDLFLLGLRCGAKLAASAHIDQEHDRHLALFLKDLDMRLVLASRHVPVNIAHIVAILIFTYFGKRHTMTLECRLIASCEDVGTQSTRLYLYPTYFLY